MINIKTLNYLYVVLQSKDLTIKYLKDHKLLMEKCDCSNWNFDSQEQYTREMFLR